MLFQYDADSLPKVRMMGQVRYIEPWIHFPRCINEFVLYVIRDGDMYFMENENRYHLRAGDFFVIEPGLLHKGYRKAPCDYYYAHFTHSGMKRIEDEANAMAELAEKRRRCLASYNLEAADPTDSITYVPKHYHLSGGEYKAQLHGAVECYNSREEHYKRRASAILHAFLLEVSHDHLLSECSKNGKRTRKSEAVAEQLLRYLSQNYSKPLTSQIISDMFEMNFDYLNRVFSAITGSPIFTYLNILRVYNAKKLILTTDLPFFVIAELVGIEDRYYFSKLFRKMTGLSPTEYYREVRSL